MVENEIIDLYTRYSSLTEGNRRLFLFAIGRLSKKAEDAITLLSGLPPDEAFLCLKWLAKLLSGMRRDEKTREQAGEIVAEHLCRHIRDILKITSSWQFVERHEELALAEAKRHRDRKPDEYNKERDAEIVRLRNITRPGQRQRTFGEIAKEINQRQEKNLGRALDPVEKMNYRSVQLAYYRATGMVKRKKSDTN